MNKKHILENFYENNKKSLQKGIIKDFLSIEKNKELLEMALIDNTEESKKNLDDSFKQFILKLKLVKYISSLIYYYTIDFDKRNRKRSERFKLLLDAPISNDTTGENPTLLIDLVSSLSVEDTYLEVMEFSDGWIEDEELHRIYSYLTEKQRNVLELIYLKGFSNKEVAKIYNVSPQNISILHKRAIQKIRDYYDNDN